MNHALLPIGDYFIFQSGNRKILFFIVCLSNQTSLDCVTLRRMGRGKTYLGGKPQFPDPVSQLSTVQESSDYISDTDDLFIPDSSQMTV